MKAREIFAKTMPFVWAKLLLGLATVLVSIILFAIIVGIALMFRETEAGTVVLIVGFTIWLSAIKVVSFILNHYFGYLVKAGHIAVITEAVTTGRVPDNQVAYGKQMVMDRFIETNVYFLIDKLVNGAVRQIQKGVRKVGSFIGMVPGMKNVMGIITSIINLFISIALGYVDECCLGWSFYKKDQGRFKSAADGVVIYWHNWKTLFKDAAKTTAIVIILLIVGTLLFFLLFITIFSFIELVPLKVGLFFIAIFLAWAVKSAFIDSYVLVKMMVSYMEVAPTTVITFDLYDKLCTMSNKFKELFTKGKAESPTPATANNPTNPDNSTENKPVFCGECGAQNNKGERFCGSCGKPLA